MSQMEITPEEAIRRLQIWKRKRINLSGFLQTTAFGVKGIQIKPWTGMQMIFKGQISEVTPMSLAIELEGSKEGSLILHTNEAVFEYRDKSELQPPFSLWAKDNFEHFIDIYGGWVLEKGKQQAPGWQCVLLEPVEIAQSEYLN